MVLDVVNVSSGVNFATQHRFPKIIHGDYLKGGLTNTLMLKDVTLYLEMVGQLGVPSLNAGGPVASFGLARALGYADEISNTVVDAIGDIAGGVRLHDGTRLMIVLPGRQGHAESEKRTATFSGDVWADPVLPGVDGITIATIFFAPWRAHVLAPPRAAVRSCW